VVTEYRLSKENIYANTFEFDYDGNILATTEPIHYRRKRGKVKLLKELQFAGRDFGIGVMVSLIFS